MSELARRVRERRAALGLSQEELADPDGIPLQILHH